MLKDLIDKLSGGVLGKKQITFACKNNVVFSNPTSDINRCNFFFRILMILKKKTLPNLLPITIL